MQPHVIHSASKLISPFLKKDTSVVFLHFSAVLIISGVQKRLWMLVARRYFY